MIKIDYDINAWWINHDKWMFLLIIPTLGNKGKFVESLSKVSRIYQILF